MPDCVPVGDIWSIIPVGDIWSIGSAYEEMLREKGVTTAAEFRDLPDLWIWNEMTVVGLRIAWELCGCSCLDRERVWPGRKTLVRSRSFDERVDEKGHHLQEALAKHAQRSTEKPRKESPGEMLDKDIYHE